MNWLGKNFTIFKENREVLAYLLYKETVVYRFTKPDNFLLICGELNHRLVERYNIEPVFGICHSKEEFLLFLDSMFFFSSDGNVLLDDIQFNKVNKGSFLRALYINIVGKRIECLIK